MLFEGITVLDNCVFFRVTVTADFSLAGTPFNKNQTPIANGPLEILISGGISDMIH
jgi:hypothetical protein